jgi:hypothetical protein
MRHRRAVGFSRSLWFIILPTRLPHHHHLRSPHPLFSSNMAARPGPRSNEGYPSSPSTDPHGPFGDNAQAPRYYDNESDNADNYNRRDTYGSDQSNPGYPENDRYYDHNGPYDPYGKAIFLSIPHFSTLPPLFQVHKTRIQMEGCMVNVTNPLLNLSLPPD